MTKVFAFACWHRLNDEATASIVNAPTAGKARYSYLLDIREPLPDVTFADIRVRSLGPAHSSDDFKRCASKRGLPDARCGDRVKVGDDEGWIVGHNSSANFDVLFDTGRYAGQTLNCHPSTVEFREGGSVEVGEKP